MRFLAAFFVVYAGFALFQAVAKGQPLARDPGPGSRRQRVAARTLALAALPAAAAILSPAGGAVEAWLVTAVLVCFVASLFVLVAPVFPKATWALALAAPVATAALLILMSSEATQP